MNKIIKVSAYLYELAEIINKIAPLYITGGYVRNHIMGIPQDDIDIASYVNPKQIIELLKGSDYKVVPVSLKLGTINIIRGDETYEYTSFRNDNYGDRGQHRPESIVFVKDIRCDATRRDFTVNAIYYDIIGDKVLDFFNGIEDIRNKVIKTTVNPYKVFAEDGLRIMRLIRFVSGFGFSIEPSTYQSCKDNIGLLKDIAPERIQTELIKILNGDIHYELDSLAHFRGLEYLSKIGALDIIFPILDTSNLELVKQADSDIRLATLLLSGNNSCAIIEQSLNNLRFKKSEIKTISRLKDILNNKVKDNIETLELIIDNYDIIDKYIRLLILFNRLSEARIIKDILDEIAQENLPHSVTLLDVRGEDLIDLGVPKHNRAKVLRNLLISVIDKGLKGREPQLNYLKEKIL